jgi:hypothetical protein
MIKCFTIIHVNWFLAVSYDIIYRYLLIEEILIYKHPPLLLQ